MLIAPSDAAALVTAIGRSVAGVVLVADVDPHRVVVVSHEGNGALRIAGRISGVEPMSAATSEPVADGRFGEAPGGFVLRASRAAWNARTIAELLAVALPLVARELAAAPFPLSVPFGSIPDRLPASVPVRLDLSSEALAALAQPRKRPALDSVKRGTVDLQPVLGAPLADVVAHVAAGRFDGVLSELGELEAGHKARPEVLAAVQKRLKGAA